MMAFPKVRGHGQSSQDMGPREDPAREAGPGRLADTPSEIPPRGWWDISLRIYRNFSDHRLLALAAGITYYNLLAIFPALAALVAIYGLFSNPATISAHLDQISGVVPQGGLDIARDQLTRVASKGSQTLGWTFLAGLAVSLWSANAAMKSMFDALNVVHGETEKRGLIKLNAVSLGFTVVGILFVLIAIAGVVALPIALNYLGLSRVANMVLRIGRWPALFVLIAVVLSVIYRFGPSREAPRWRWITWGSSFATVLWLLASGLFSWYTANFGTYNETYGSLGAVIGFMVWMWISAIAILLGAELDAEMEHQTARDTTTGGERPLGARGARVAATIGERQAG